MPKRQVKQSKIVECSTLWVVLMDDAPIRGAAMEQYRALENEMRVAESALDHFQQIDLPAFEQWKVRTFGALLTEIRELNEAFASKHQFYLRIEELRFYRDCSEVEAYRQVLRDDEEIREGRESEEHPEFDFEGEHTEEAEEVPADPKALRKLAEKFISSGFDPDQFGNLPKPMRQAFQDGMEDLAEMTCSLLGVAPISFRTILKEASRLLADQRAQEEQRQAKRDAKRRAKRDEAKKSVDDVPSKKDQPTASTRLRELFRQLARLLHPDHNPEAGKQELELWYAAQESYRRGDLDQLEAVHAKVELTRGSDPGGLAISRIFALVGEMKSALRGLRSELKRASKSMAWRLAKSPGKQASLASTIGRELTTEKHILQEDLRNITSVLTEIEAKANRSRKKRRV